MGKQTAHDHCPTEPAGPAAEPTTAPATGLATTPAAAPATGLTRAGERR
ncbi:hypothetical protein [Streptomyces sp. NBC_00872]|nr:hypothetical protein OG214_21595 [Streptomyces sp. NBC_00872]